MHAHLIKETTVTSDCYGKNTVYMDVHQPVASAIRYTVEGVCVCVCMCVVGG